VSEKGAVREDLLRLAIEVIETEGEVGVRVNHLVEAAGVTAPTLYHYFGSRDGLIVEAQAERFIRGLRRDLVAMRPILAEVRTKRQARTAVRSLVDSLMSPSRSGWRMARVNILGSALARGRLAARLAETQDEVLGAIADMFRPLQEAGLIRRDLHLPTAMYWISGLFMSRVLIEIGHSDVRPEAWDDLTRSAVMSLLFADPDRS
jgi:AcrR family transcriptional regulator